MSIFVGGHHSNHTGKLTGVATDDASDTSYSLPCKAFVPSNCVADFEESCVGLDRFQMLFTAKMTMHRCISFTSFILRTSCRAFAKCPDN